MNVHEKPRAGILLEVDLSVRPESYYYYYYYYYCDRHLHLEANYCNLLQTMAFHNMCRNQLGKTIYLT